jgi:hypothetical protein
MFIDHEEESDLSTPVRTSNPLEPLMPIADAAHWLYEYFNDEVACMTGDDLAACFSSALVLGTESSTILAKVTSFPGPFIAAVCSEMNSKQLWHLPQAGDLAARVRKAPHDWHQLQDDLNDWTEVVWRSIWTPEAYIALESLRQRTLFGGVIQDWTDKDALEYFNLA